MNLSAIDFWILTASLIVASTPILLAGLGELVVERAGVLNLGVEGMMITGAIAGFATAVHSGSPVMGFVGGAAAGAAMSLIFAVLTQYLLANQMATGLALTLFGLGFSALVGQGYVGAKPPMMGKLDLGPISDIPGIGVALFRHDIMVYLSFAAVIGTWYFLNRTRAGLVLRAVGENHDAAHALGYKVVRIRMLAIMFGGAMAGLGGAYLSLIRVPLWTEGMTSGAGWIAVALVVFASWKPGRLLLGAWIFGGITVLQLNLQVAGVQIPTEYLSMSPYLITILVLVVMSAMGGRKAKGAPGALGRSFHATH
ncbi:ABC transporter permease [Falsigemmobacter intermedius]|uniref:ABC transporter permease n=1 Tax=Falsigemmobacter intermedius TaxID=1553448 RepID=A0A444MDV9_9RHOB|nr:ABC transporter permease [Falsigemmobacter intermedius]RWY42988.1 ABC transporter permease [Falsigemmobacter intermedius]